MTIRAKLQISAIVLISLAAATGVTLLLLSRAVTTTQDKTTIAHQLAQEIWALNAFTNDYLFHQGERAQTQWQAQYAAIVALLTQQRLTFTTPQERTIFEAAQQDLRSINDIFVRLVTLRDARRQPAAEAGVPAALSLELEERLASQILVRSQSMIGAATQLSENSVTERARARRQADFLVLFLIVTFILLTGGTILPLYRNIVTTIAKLREGTEVIAAGNLDYRVKVDGADELRQVSQAFNTMAVKLKDSYERLEEKIRDRTAELTLVNAELQREVAEHKRTEETLRRIAAELIRSNADLEQFAYAASHDLQEPLRAVTGCVQLLQQRYTGQLDSRADELIRHTVDGATRMQALITDLLAYARVTTRSTPFVPVDCTTVLDQALANLRVAIAESGAVVTHDPLPTVPADATQLLQLLQNLISNAIKFRREAPPAIHIGAERQASAWLLTVRDNGIGLEPQFAERIFGLFQRLHTRQEYPGTGIGLAMCKKIVERHGGRMWVASELGQGATFCFTLHAMPEETLAMPGC